MPPIPKVDPAAIELSYWETIKNSTDPEDFKSYLRKYPDGQFAELARRRANPAGPTGNISSPSSSAKPNQPSATNTQPAQQGMLMADIFTLGFDMGIAEIASYQNAAPVSIMTNLGYSQTVATRSGLSTQGIDYVVNQLRAGAAPSSQYQNLVAARQAYEQALNRNCNCGNVVNMNNVFTLGAQLGFIETVTFENGDRNYIANLMVSAIQYATAIGLPTDGLNELLRQVRSAKRVSDLYQGFVTLRGQIIQATSRSCGC
jgi:hypothetical protein